MVIHNGTHCQIAVNTSHCNVRCSSSLIARLGQSVQLGFALARERMKDMWPEMEFISGCCHESRLTTELWCPQRSCLPLH